ncbi:MAG: DNA polymerase III subunit beta [Deltaproteobacteria bacterium]|nr:DNA polymerase III subunit beta [Deltaproteobacteria bacterium]
MLNLKVKREDLTNALAACTSIMDAKSNLAVLQNVLLTAEDGGLSLRSTDIDLTYQTRIPADVLEPGTVALPGKTFLDIVKVGNAEDVTVSIDEVFLAKVSCGALDTTIYGLSADDFPRLLETDNAVFCDVDARDLADGIDKTIMATTVGDETYTLKGVYFTRAQINQDRGRPEPAPVMTDALSSTPDPPEKPAAAPGDEAGTPQRMEMVSTDAQHMTVATILAESLDFLPPEEGILVPRKGLQQMLNICRSADVVSLAMALSNLVVKTENTFLAVRLLEGRFPDYADVVPANNDIKIWLNSKDLAEVLKRTSVILAKEFQIAVFDFQPGLLTISCMNASKGTTKESMAIDYKDRGVVVRFNPHFYLDILKTLKSQNILLEYNEANPAFLLTAPEDPGFYGVIGVASSGDASQNY